MKLSVIIPVYNEFRTIEKIILKVRSLNLDLQILVVDDCSNDGTKEILTEKCSDYIDDLIFHERNLGKGAAIKSAKNKVKGDFVIIQDADLEYDPNDYIKMIKIMTEQNLKVLYGSRVLNKSIFQNLQNFSHAIRIIGNIFLTKFSNFLNNQNLTDAHTCYKMFESDLFKKIDLNENGFNFCPEITTKISKINVEIQEIEINYQGRSYKQGKKIKSIDGFYAILTILKYKFFK